MARIAPVSGRAEPAEVRETFASIQARGGEPSPLYRTLAYAPALLQTWAAFAHALRTRTQLPRSLAELVIMRLAQLSCAPYQWAYHWTPALAAGLTESQLQALEEWRHSSEFDTHQRAALAYVEAMFEGTVDDADFAPVEATFGTQLTVELTLTVGFYINVGRVLQALQIDVDPSKQGLLP